MKPSMAIRNTCNISLSPTSNFKAASPIPRLVSLPKSSSVFLQSSSKSKSINFTSKRVCRTVSAYSADGDTTAGESKAKALRRILDSPGIHQGPACFDALGAKLVERAGFDFCFTTGFGISASRLGLPDTGLISYGEMVDQGHQITQAVSIPIIGDGDNGYGNAMNVKRTVKGYISAGFAGIVLEDQDALTAIKGGLVPPPGSMPSFEEVEEILGFNTYYEEEKQYSTSTGQLSPQRLFVNKQPCIRYSTGDSSTDQRDQNPRDPVVEVITPDVYNNYGADGTRDPFSGIWSRTL